MRKIPVLLASSLILFLCSGAVQAATMRCGRDLVARGDHQGEVLAACGEPLLSRQSTIYRSGVPNRRFRHLGFGNSLYEDITSRELAYHNRSVVEVPVEIWTYNFGPHQFMREVTFIDGKVTFIKTLGYGH